MSWNAIKALRAILFIAALGLAACHSRPPRPHVEALPEKSAITASATPRAVSGDLENSKAVAVLRRTEPDENIAPGALGKIEDNYLIAIGINRFDDPSVSPLSFCVNDAKAIYNFFIANGFVPQSQAYLLHTGATDPNRQPTRNNILAVIQYVADNATPDSTIILHFSGHGFVDDKKNSYLLPQDGKVAILRDTAVPVTRVNEMLEESSARRKILFLDACRNAARKDHKGVEVSQSAEFLAALAASEGQITLASCGAGQFSFEMPETSMGVFTHFLIHGLMGAAPSDSTGLITLDSVAAYVKSRVPEWSRANQKPVQQPWSEGKMAVSIPLAIKGMALKPLPASERPFETFAPPRIPDYTEPGGPTIVQSSPNAAVLEVTESGAVPADLKDAVRPEFIAALNELGIKVVEEKAEIAVQAGFKIKVNAQYSKTSVDLAGQTHENLVLTLSASVLNARTGEVTDSVKPEEFRYRSDFPTGLRQGARDFIARYAEKTAALVRK